jgi:hypothetical protein
MRIRFSFKLGFIILALVTLSACKLQREPQPTAQPAYLPNPTLPVVHLTADQVARAMEEDRFFSDYAQTTLLIQGTVYSVKRLEGHLIIGLDTTVSTKVMCDLGAYFGIVHLGALVTVQSTNPQRDASRQGSAVMLKNCTIP